MYLICSSRFFLKTQQKLLNYTNYTSESPQLKRKITNIEDDARKKLKSDLFRSPYDVLPRNKKSSMTTIIIEFQHTEY